MKKTLIIAISAITISISIGNAALSIRTSNVDGFDNSTNAIVDNAGNAIPLTTGIVAVGSFGTLTDEDIRALGSASAISSSFSLVVSTDFNVLAGLWDANPTKAGDTSADAGRAIFTVIGNEATVADSTQFLIYRHSAANGSGNFNETPNANTDAFVGNGANATGNLVVGGFDNFQHDFGAGEFAAFNLVAVPEPSSTALLGLGGLALIIRRRR